MSLAFYLTIGAGATLMLSVVVFAAIQGMRRIAQQNDTSRKASHT